MLTSPKRNAPFEGTPTDYVGGSENRPPKRYGYKSSRPKKVAPEGSPFPSRWGYKTYEPPPPWPSPPPRRLYQPDTDDRPPKKERVSIKKDQAGSAFGGFVSVASAFVFFVSGIFVSMVGALALIRVFGGKASADFFRGKAE